MHTLEEITRQYQASLADKRERAAALWRPLQDGAADEIAVQTLKRFLHDLGSSAGAYGFMAVMDHARRLERALVAWLEVDPAAREPVSLLAARTETDRHALDRELRDAAEGDAAR